MCKLKQEKGFLLISAFMVVVFLAILSAAIFSQSISENTLICNLLARLQAKYNAELGFNCVAYELINGGSDWVTQVSDAATPYTLHKNPLALTLALSDSNERLENNNDPETSFNSGIYQSKAGDFQVKIYKDPILGQEDQFIVLSRGISANTTYLLAAKISSSSLYENFIFSPDTMQLDYMTFSAKGGKMHANKDIILTEGANILDVAELSTPEAIKFTISSETPLASSCLPAGPGLCNWHGYFYTRYPPYRPLNSIGTSENMYASELHARGERQGLYMQNPTWPASGSKYTLCTNPANCIHSTSTIAENFYIYNAADSYLTNGVFTGLYSNLMPNIKACQPPCVPGPTNPNPTIQIPSRLSQAYTWDKHYDTSSTDPANQRGGVWYDGQWQYSGPPENISVNYFNSAMQPSAFRSWLDANNSLRGVMKDRNTGGETISPVKINAETYFNKAQTDGIYIYRDLDNDFKLTMQINGGAPPNGATVVEDAAGVFNFEGAKIARKDYFIDYWSTNTKNIIKLDIEKMRKHAQTSPSNGIIYAEYDVALTNAEKIFEDTPANPGGGLTTVTNQNCYLVGNYNTEDYQPSAVISAKDIYTLSKDFKFPHSLPYTTHNPNYPFTQEDNPPSNPPNPYNETAWQASAVNQNRMPNRVSEDTTYYVSMVGYRGLKKGRLLERWKDNSGQLRARTIVGAFVGLEKDNFQWPEYEQDPNEGWPIFDENHIRCGTGAGFLYMGTPGRDCATFAGWPTEDLWTTYPNPAIVQFESRYNTSDATTLPPGGLPGYYVNVMLEIPDTNDNFTHHYQVFN